MGSIIGACCGSMFAGMCCGACAQCKPAKSGPSSRIPYLFILILSGIFATFMALYGEEHWDLGLTQINCSGCTGNGSVFRVSFCLFLFELLHVVFIGLGAVSFHWMFFAMKFLVYIVCVVITFFYGNNSMYSNYAQFARYGPSPIYLIIQILLLITYGYELNDKLQRKGNEGSKWPYIILVGGSITLYIFSFTLLGLFYYFYGGSSCHTHNALISISIILVILCALFSGYVGKGNFFVSAVVAFYLTYLAFSGLQAANWCNKLSSDSDSTYTIWIGVIFALFALCYAALKSNWLNLLFVGDEEDSDMSKPLLVDSNNDSTNKENVNDKTEEDEETGSTEDKPTDEEETDMNKSNYDDPELESVKGDDDGQQKLSIKKQALYFHILMTLAAAYMSMLLTNWGTSKKNTVATTGKASTWINFVTQWVTCVLFFWTLLAPKLCPQRFNDEDEE